jgi:hypothetical protein
MSVRVEGVHDLSWSESGDAIGVLVTAKVAIGVTIVLKHEAVTHSDLDVAAHVRASSDGVSEVDRADRPNKLGGLQLDFWVSNGTSAKFHIVLLLDKYSTALGILWINFYLFVRGGRVIESNVTRDFIDGEGGVTVSKFQSA